MSSNVFRLVAISDNRFSMAPQFHEAQSKFVREVITDFKHLRKFVACTHHDVQSIVELSLKLGENMITEEELYKKACKPPVPPKSLSSRHRR